jgi:hypothetical protein
VALFFIDTSTGQVATGRQLDEAGVLLPSGLPPRPWLRIQGTGDATTMWYAVLRKEVSERSGDEREARGRSVYIGTLALRHTEHLASLLQQGWHEVPIPEIGNGLRLTPPRELG